tara:strand:+ start:897 stop:1220 length:324 start_codon:yes stop_codon:yes gene_type:complete
MAAEIISYDIAGSSYTGYFGEAKDYRKERAVRRFLVNGNDRKGKTQILEDVAALIDDSDNNKLYPVEAVYTNGHIPLQEMSIQRVGRSSTDEGALLWIVEAVYYYPF